MKPLTILSLFDGISCGRVALQRAGIPVAKYYASEVDPYAIKVTQKNWPDTIQLGDVKQVWARNLPKIDLLIGGSPCQDLSIAKQNRKGLSGQKSGLFWHYVRLLRTTKPRWFLLENVASMSHADRSKITEILGVEPVFINSALVSAQQRKRLYWSNIPGITQPADKCILLKDILDSGLATSDKSNCLDANYWKTPGSQVFNQGHARNRRPMVYEPINLGYLGKGGQGRRVYSVFGKSVCLSAGLGGGTQQWVKIDLPDGNYTIRKLSPVECERLQTLPDGYSAGVSNTQRYRAIGNGWTVDVIAHIFSFIPKEDK